MTWRRTWCGPRKGKLYELCAVALDIDPVAILPHEERVPAKDGFYFADNRPRPSYTKSGLDLRALSDESRNELLEFMTLAEGALLGLTRSEVLLLEQSGAYPSHGLVQLGGAGINASIHTVNFGAWAMRAGFHVPPVWLDKAGEGRVRARMVTLLSDETWTLVKLVSAANAQTPEVFVSELLRRGLPALWAEVETADTSMWAVMDSMTAQEFASLEAGVAPRTAAAAWPDVERHARTMLPPTTELERAARAVYGSDLSAGALHARFRSTVRPPDESQVRAGPELHARLTADADRLSTYWRVLNWLHSAISVNVLTPVGQNIPARFSATALKAWASKKGLGSWLLIEPTGAPESETLGDDVAGLKSIMAVLKTSESSARRWLTEHYGKQSVPKKNGKWCVSRRVLDAIRSQHP